MNINQINESFDDSLENQPSDQYTPKRFKTRDILIFAVCVVLAFICWAYAHHQHDPVVEAKVSLNFILENAETNESISNTSCTEIIIHAEKSLLSDISHIDVIVDRTLFDSYGTPVSIKIILPEGLHSHTKEVEVTIDLTKPN
jgi:hypothetical protein